MNTILFRDAGMLGGDQASPLFWRPIVPESMDFSQRLHCGLRAFGVGRCGCAADVAILLLWDRAKHNHRLILNARLILEIPQATGISADYARRLLNGT